MSKETILAEIDAEIATLMQVRKLLTGTGSVSSAIKEPKPKKSTGRARAKRVLSADARKRIADAQRKRWAAQRAKSKKEA